MCWKGEVSFLESHQCLACLPLAAMGVLFHTLNLMPANLPDIKREFYSFLDELRRPYKMWRMVNQTAFYSFVFGSLAFLLPAVSFGLDGNYTVASWCFAGGWICACVSACIAFSIFSRRVRVPLTLLTCLITAFLYGEVYVQECPTFKLSPPDVTFETWAQQSQTFRIQNMSDRDLYMASFIFDITSQVYSVGDFTFKIPPESVKPLNEQPAESDHDADIFGILGPLPQSHHFFVLCVYHFTPHESREVTITLEQHVATTEREFDIRTRTMSYSRKALPVSKVGDMVLVPIRVDRALTMTEFLPCWTNTNPACMIHPQLGRKAAIPEGCSYWGVSDSPNEPALHLRFPECN